MGTNNWKSWASFAVTILLFVSVVIPIAIIFVLVEVLHKLFVILLDTVNPKGKR